MQHKHWYNWAQSFIITYRSLTGASGIEAGTLAVLLRAYHNHPTISVLDCAMRAAEHSRGLNA